MDVTKWEYTKCCLGFHEELAKLGQNGWEIVGIDNNGGSSAVLKRPCGRIHVEEVEVDHNHSKQFSQTELNYDDDRSRQCSVEQGSRGVLKSIDKILDNPLYYY